MRPVAALVVAGLLVGCTPAPKAVPPVDDTTRYTLYRNSVVDATMRLHVASFDTKDGEAYNRENCEAARVLFQGQDGVRTHFWCERGSVK